MVEYVDILWVRDGVERNSACGSVVAGVQLVHSFLKEELSSRAPNCTCRPEKSSDRHSEEDISYDDFDIPASFWNSVQVDWDDKHPYFKFWQDGKVWLAPNLVVERQAALEYVDSKRSSFAPADPKVVEIIRSVNAGETSAKSKISNTSSGGRARTHDWAAAAGALAGHLHIEGRQSHANLTRFTKAWFQSRGRVPDPREVERFVTEVLRAFGETGSEG